MQSAKAWHAFWQDKLVEQTTFSIAEIYQLYEDFYQDLTTQAAIEQDLLNALKKSVEVIRSKVLDPVAFPNKNKIKDDKPKIKKNSLRGDNRFVQMAVWNIGNGQDPFPNQYAYEENDDEGQLTLETNTICGNGVTGKDLLDFMAKKHHNIKDGVKKVYKNNLLLSEARSPDSPIYLSYIPADLKQVEAQPHQYAIYYAIGKNQAIGALSRDQYSEKND